MVANLICRLFLFLTSKILYTIVHKLRFCTHRPLYSGCGEHYSYVECVIESFYCISQTGSKNFYLVDTLVSYVIV